MNQLAIKLCFLALILKILKKIRCQQDLRASVKKILYIELLILTLTVFLILCPENRMSPIMINYLMEIQALTIMKKNVTV